MDHKERSNIFINQTIFECFMYSMNDKQGKPMLKTYESI